MQGLDLRLSSSLDLPRQNCRPCTFSLAHGLAATAPIVGLLLQEKSLRGGQIPDADCRSSTVPANESARSVWSINSWA
ncbi:hypothetical protein HETIRDRAFT_410302 [Heterobasidion irregulare TC 32-1]|uniref:Uncharacterized protein n=1 Tax=Heterobasidion irregulare (strain TC 32-1) TaxID=747525 RepID=W4K161_HETIT|nr:uncharacterized protein HETIRDRAFT_410302 [Heterobasidion irregulare TC 32-1]ETW79459.1 hypothetical protein HETIRDRAFT_410302 [Heterobasidion irregulare TC 32-1]